MKRLGYALGFYPALPLLVVLSLMPWPVLRGVGAGLAWLLGWVVGYRRAVIDQNLARAFPLVPASHRARYRHQFYHHFISVWLEVVKSWRGGGRLVRQRCTLTNPQLLQQYYQAGQSIIIAMGHMGNWEWVGGALAQQSDMPIHILYKELRNPHWNRFLKQIRLSYGPQLMEKDESLRRMMELRQQVTATVFIADQTPQQLAGAHWVQFFGTEVPAYSGAAKLAQKFRRPLVFLAARRVRTGHYELTLEPLWHPGTEATEEELSQRIATRLESLIRQQPPGWLWSHRRWKRARLPQETNPTPLP